MNRVFFMVVGISSLQKVIFTKVSFKMVPKTDKDR